MHTLTCITPLSKSFCRTESLCCRQYERYTTCTSTVWGVSVGCGGHAGGETWRCFRQYERYTIHAVCAVHTMQYERYRTLPLVPILLVT